MVEREIGVGKMNDWDYRCKLAENGGVSFVQFIIMLWQNITRREKRTRRRYERE